MKLSFGFLPVPGSTGELAATLERLGFDAVTLADSPLLAGEIHGQLMIAAGATKRLEIVSGLTNSVTRDASVTASAFAALQIESDGRGVCGIGRGDSAVFKIGKQPDTLALFERYLVSLRHYLADGMKLPSGDLSRIEWLASSTYGKKPVPIEIAPSGPAMLALAGRHADRISLAVGAAPDYVGDYVRRARAAVEVAGRDPDSVTYGAYIPLVANDDTAIARYEVRRIASAFVHFSAMKGQRRDRTDERMPDSLRLAGNLVGSRYSYQDDPYKNQVDDGPLSVMSDEFIDWFTIAGPQNHVVDRLRALSAVGIDYVHILSGHHALPPEVRDKNIELLGNIASLGI